MEEGEDSCLGDKSRAGVQVEVGRQKGEGVAVGESGAMTVLGSGIPDWGNGGSHRQMGAYQLFVGSPHPSSLNFAFLPFFLPMSHPHL